MAAQWVGQFSHRISMLAVAAQGVMNVKEHPTHIILADFANFLDGFASSLKELQKELEVVSNPSSNESQQRDMEAELTAVEQLVMAQKGQSQLLSFLSSPFLHAKLQSCREALSRDIESMIPEACSAVVKLQIARTQRLLKQSSGPKLGLQEQAVIESLSTITEDSTPQKCKEVAVQVAEYLGKAVSDVAFAEQLAEARRDIGKTGMSGDTGFSTQLESCIKALEKGFGFQNTPGAGEVETLMAKNRVQDGPKEVGAQALAPLPSFICPLTKQVMKDPVQIASGQTFEKSAIMQWFKDGKTTSPVTGERLRNTKVSPNYALRQSITEWRERNYNLRLDNAESRLRSIQPMEQARGARDIKILCEEDAINKYSVASRKLIPQLIRLADTPKISATLRELCFNALAALALDHREIQETLVFEGVIDVLVRCLRNREEAEPAINLLKILSGSSNIAEIIGLKPDAVLLLVTFLGHENESLVVSVKAVLVNLPTSDENIVIMAEANLMKPLVTRLVEGGKESKIVMARTLGRLKHMPDSSRSLASTRDTITTLINMTSSDDEEEVDAAVLALKNLSTVPSVGILIADCSGLEVLIKLLSTKQTSVNMPKVGASYIVANVLHAVGNEWPPSDDKEADIDNYLETIFILVSSSTKPPTSPAVQSHLLQGLLGLVEGKDTGRVVKGIMMRRNVFSILTSHFRDTRPETRRDSLKLFSALSRKHGAEAWSAIKIHSGTLALLVDMLKAEEKISETEKVAAARIIAHLPVEDHALTITLRELEMVPLLVKYLTSPNQNIQEAAMGALVRFTSPESLDLQKQLAEMGVIPIFVNLLDSQKHRTKINASRALANFAKSTPQLVKPVAPTTCWQCFAPAPVSCKLHGSLCSVESTFCLLAADAVDPLLAIVAEPPSEPNKKAAEAALGALYALVENDQFCERGCYVIHQAGGVPIILKNLPNCTPRAQEISIDMCERFFKIPQFLNSFGASAQMHIITVAQNAAIPRTRGVANRILRQLDLLGSLAGSQSHYVSSSTTSGAGRSTSS
ncbi:hypothetical protein KC19_11G040400 [Ceratodon purpureus]|uniref:RING-type E3 ubiquitin transferase n=1 Tax=Ceratodon purpureus TaxID=3225 RepID=A0A8T0GEM4_CERPU|nr:hypothetical protein KC19_11G040400 [Ceratodon purpureus]KAG0556275.1 hypothetical protein KC19_11G040400 [Ceratodon purpureus]KAG0556277.1 hypothetical protein KC19_11G040400 [Ceratodon purpureus]KAG0556278.1 hypothetical protein KC19_11G040400 [Ceratodon purpureus]